MAHIEFTKEDKLKAMAIVRVFETGKASGDYAACVVLDDGAGISYGISQFTHRSGSLLAVVEKYLASGGAVGREVIAERLSILKRTSKPAIEKLSADEQFKKALKAASISREMREAQETVAFENYLQPAVDECARLGFKLPLSLAVVYDSIVHGSWGRLRDHVGKVDSEKKWVTEYVRIRHRWLLNVPRLKKTSYRTAFFLKQIALGKWDLDLPLTVHGLKISSVGLDLKTAKNPSVTTDGNDKSQPDSSIASRDEEVAAPAEKAQPTENVGPERCLDDLEARVNSVAEKVDQAERIVITTATRTDKAKSLWTTVAGTAWQMAWAIGGFLAGLPREVWLIVAVIAGLLMLLFLYRQIVLGKQREGLGSNVQSPKVTGDEDFGLWTWD